MADTAAQEGLRLSEQQERIWLAQGGAGAVPLASRCTLRLAGNLDRPALARALAAVVARHEALRLAFVLPPAGGLPLQVAQRPYAPRQAVIDLAALPAAARHSAGAAIDRDLARLPGSLAPPAAPLRAYLLTHERHHHHLMLVLPALCADRATLALLAAEVASIYRLPAGESLAAPALQYLDVAAWQDELLTSADTAEGLERWRQHWREHDMPALLAARLPLLTGGAPPAGMKAFAATGIALTALVALDDELTAAIGSLLAIWGCSFETLALVSWQVVLGLSAGRREVVVGVLDDGRQFEELQHVLGPRARYLPVAGVLEAALPVREIALRADAATRDAVLRQDYFSWRHLLPAPGTAGKLAGTPDEADYFPACFAAEPAAGGDLPAALVRSTAPADRCDVELTCSSRPPRLTLRYAAARLPRAAAELLAARLGALLRQLAARPEARLADVDLTGLGGDGERRQLLSCGRGAAAAPAACIHLRFAEQAARTPERIAVVCGGAALTYGELETRANRLARRLRALGVGRETRTAICLERSPELVVAILAVLKAGGAWLPLDAAQPAARLEHLLEESGAPAGVTTRALAARLPQGRARWVLLDGHRGEIAACPATAPPELAEPGSLAYVIYTSGSTGQPKGVLIEHRSAVNLLHGLAAAVLPPGAPLRASLNAPAIFDASVQQLVLLLAGHTLHIIPEAVRTDGAALIAHLWAAQIEVLDCTPTQLRLLLAAGLLDTPDPALRAVLAAGEAIDAPTWERLRRSPRIRFFNIYGPTECTVDVTSQAIAPPAGAPSVGRPLAGSEVLLLDRESRLAPLGAPAEIVLGGAGLARGYLGRPALTAERFVPHPFALSPGERLYRTGDLGRRHLDGGVEFLGRLDNQVKIRGYRIEPGEVEALLAAHPAVAEAVVVVRAVPGKDVALVGFVRPAAPAAPTPPATAGPPGNPHAGHNAHAALIAELYLMLRERLPSYMLPAALVPLAALPLTAGGKADRQALAARAATARAGRGASDAGYAPPRTPLEDLLAAAWEQVLGVERIGIDEDFFELGGHSLLATQLVSRIRSLLGREVAVRQLFEEPTVAGLAQAIAGGWAAERPPAPPIAPLPPAARRRPLPLSFAQQRLWFLDQLEPGSPAYNVPVGVRLEGRLDRAALAASLSEIQRRHEVLRTTFEQAGEEPVQRVAPPRPLALPLVDLGALPAARRPAAAQLLLAAAAWRPFDLRRGPLLRVLLLRLGAEEHLALLVLHHIVSDGWSMGILVRELGALYPAIAARRPPALPALPALPPLLLVPPLPELPIQYADFAAWQRGWLTGERLAEEVEVWRRRLAGAPALLELPTDRPRPPLPTWSGASVPLELDAALVASLRGLARRHGATLFMTLLAAFDILLARHSGQQDITVGTPIAGRNRLETEPLIGFFVNTLVMRADLSADPHPAAFLAQVRAAALAAYAHQDLPFEKLVEELRPERSLGHAPLFQVMLQMQNAPGAILELPGLRLSAVVPASRTAKFDLTLLLEESGETLTGMLEYSRDLFDRATARRLAGHLASLLAVLAGDADRPVSALPLLAGGERHQVLREWNDTASGPLWDGPAHQRFALWAERQPNAPALVLEQGVITYGELARRATAWAAWLVAQGIGPEARVGIAVLPSADMIVGLLAILAAGAAYVPLDPGYPPEWMAGVLADCGVALLFTQEPLRARLQQHRVRLVSLDAAPPVSGVSAVSGVSGVPAVSSPPPLTAQSAAYVIYTSGSTGKPKGVVATHGGLAAFVRAMAAALDLRPGDRMLQFASLAFDASVLQILPPLASGAAVVLHANPRGLSADALLAFCVQSEVTILDLPAALWRQWVSTVEGDEGDEGDAAAISAPIRFYLTGGEAVPVEVLRAWAARVPPATGFLSSYGPTEATVTTTAFLTTAGEVERLAGAVVPIGRPLAGVKVHLLDGGLRPLPLGAVGEVFIGGAGLTRGYLHRADLTAERFVPDPLGDDPGGRLYRTGDLARYHAGGEAEFLGRVDHQVKLRGYRIELGEIEAAIGRYPGVREKVVLLTAGPTAAADRRLVAFVVAEGPDEIPLADLRAALKQALPEPMLPAAIVALPELPITASGKLDRNALARLAAETASSGAAFARRPPVPPRDADELALMQIWEELFGELPFGIRDSFFDLGGHSLLAIRLMARIRSRFGRDLPLATLFAEPTIEQLARHLSAAAGPQARSPLIAIQAEGALPPLFCMPPVGGDVFCYYPLARRLGRGRPLYGLQAPPLAGPGAAAELSVEELAALFLDAVRKVRPSGPYLLAGWSFGGVVAFEMARQLRHGGAGEEAALLALFDTALPPGLADPTPPDSAALLAGLLWQEAAKLGAESPLGAEQLRALSRPEQLEKAREQMCALGIFGAEIDVTMIDAYLRGLTHRTLAVERYQARPYGGRITLFRASEPNDEIPASASPEQRRRLAGAALGWEDVARGGLEVIAVPGRHQTVLQEPHVTELAARLAACLAAADLPGACLPGADLPGACLPGADLPGACLPGADLAGAEAEALATPAASPAEAR